MNDSPPDLQQMPPKPPSEFSGWMAAAGFGVYVVLVAVFFLQPGGPMVIEPMIILQLTFFILPAVGFILVFFRGMRAFGIGLLVGGAICWGLVLAICGPYIFGGKKFI